MSERIRVGGVAHQHFARVAVASLVVQRPQHLVLRTELLAPWVASIGLDPAAYDTHSLRRTEATLIYRRTRNLRAVQLLLGHTKLESTVRYLSIEVDDALEIAEQAEV